MTGIKGGRRLLLCGSLALLLLSLTLLIARFGAEPNQQAAEPRREDFQVLDAIPTGLPPRVEQRLRTSPYEAVWSLARRVPLERHDVWVVPSKSGLCLVRKDSPTAVGVACAAHHYLANHGLFIASLSPSPRHRNATRREILGIAPADARAISLVTPGFPDARPRLVEGTFEYRDAVPAAPQLARIVRGRR